MNGLVVRYHYQNNKLSEKVILRLFDADDGSAPNFLDDDIGGQVVRKNRISYFRATKFTELQQNNVYLVGSADGTVYTCLYHNTVKYQGKIDAHFGSVKSLEKSPFSDDVFLTTGCDRKIQIWVGGFFKEPVKTIRTRKQVERAIWSRTNPTIIASIIGKRVFTGRSTEIDVEHTCYIYIYVSRVKISPVLIETVKFFFFL